MIDGLFLQIFSCFCILLLLIVYFSKKRLSTDENKIFVGIMITSFIGNIIHILCIFSIQNMETFPILNTIITKSYLIYLLFWLTLFTLYVFTISNIKNKLKFNLPVYICLITFLVFLVLIIVNPLNSFYDGSKMYTYGLSVDLLYVNAYIYMAIWVTCLFLNIKKIISKKYSPVFVIIVLGFFVMILQHLHPELLLMTALETLTTLVMYFTIENPDLKLINELELAKNEADRANNAKSDFLSSMSHEIRTPLNAIVGFSECIIQTEDIDEAHDNAKDVVNASETLLEIVNGILDISKIEAGKLEIINSNYNPENLFNDIIKLIKARIGDKSLDFQISIDNLPKTLYGDHTNLKKIIINLLTNAVKYTDKGFIRLNVSSVNTNDICRLMIVVEDSGRGIKKEQIDKLFTKFQRLEEDRNTTIEGTGLGLAITKQLTELMSGKIVVSSVYGEGSKFSVAIDQRISLENIETQKEETVFELDLTNKKILIVDDNKLNLKVASKLLSKYNPTIELLEDGFSCIEKIKNNEYYDLILLDDMMPKLTGVETLNELKKIPGFNISVVALTANAISGMKEKYLKAGFNDYLGKPIEKGELFRVLSNFSNKKLELNNYETKKVLLVDDNNMNLKIAENFIKPYNVLVEKSSSGKECIDKINSNGIYDLIFMDDMMPITTGTETMKKLKESGYKKPIVALTANAIEGAKEEYLNQGFDDYLSKPINRKELDRVMNRFLGNYESKFDDISQELLKDIRVVTKIEN